MKKHSNWDFWTFIEKFKTVVELIAAIVVIAPVLLAIWQFIQQGLNAVVPAWYVLITAIFSILLGTLLAQGTQGLRELLSHQRGSIQKIAFQSNQYPTAYGWKLDGYPSIENRLDGFVGNVIDISAKSNYRMDFTVDASAEIGKIIEYVAKLGVEARISVLVLVQDQDRTQSKELWLTFMTGNNPFKRVDDGTWYEYEVYLLPIRLPGGWHKYQVNLKDAVRRSAGREGWQLDRLKQIRVRGNLSLSYFNIS